MIYTASWPFQKQSKYDDYFIIITGFLRQLKKVSVSAVNGSSVWALGVFRLLCSSLQQRVLHLEKVPNLTLDAGETLFFVRMCS